MSLLSAVLQEADKGSTRDLKKRREDIVSKVKDLTERVQLLSFALHQNFVDTHVNFSPTKSLEQLNYKNRKSNIVNDHQNLVSDVEVYREKFGESDEEFIATCNKLDAALKSFNDLCIVAEAQYVLGKSNHEFGRYNYREAMLAVTDLQNRLQSLKFEGNPAKALSNLRAQAENLLSLYSAHLSVEWEDIFSWDEKKGVNSLTYSLSVQQSDPILIQNVLKTLHATGRLNTELSLFSNFFIEKLLRNLIGHNCDIFTEDDIGALVFNIKINLDETKKPDYQTIFNNLTAVLDFLHSTLGSQFDNGKKFIEVFADSIRGKFFATIIEECIRKHLPSCDSSYENYKSIVVELDSFNKFLIDKKFVEAEKSPLNKYIDDTECVLYNKKCDKLLSDVRELMNESLSHKTIVVGTEKDVGNETIVDESEKEAVWDLNKPLFLPKCVISHNVKQIMGMIVDHLEESSKLPEKYSRQLVAYVRDIAVMYQCLIPKKFKVNLECCPRDIALFFNNCFYLSHSLLGPPWRALPSPLAGALPAALLEAVQDLRVLGLEKVSLYLQGQRQTIVDSLRAEDSSEWSHSTYEQLERATNSALSLFRNLRGEWRSVLPHRMYEMALCTLVQALYQALLERIFSCSRPAGEELVHMLAVRLEDVHRDVLTLFEDPSVVESKIPSWSRVQGLPQLLRAQLLELSQLWAQGRLSAFTCEEVRHLVKARFPDDKYRLRILQEIQ